MLFPMNSLFNLYLKKKNDRTTKITFQELIKKIFKISIYPIEYLKTSKGYKSFFLFTAAEMSSEKDFIKFW